MARKKTSVSDLLVKQAEKELKKLKNGKLAIKLKVILAYKKHNANIVADVFQISVRNLFLWVNAFRKKGIEGLIDRPKGHYNSKLTTEQLKQIKEWIIIRKDYDGNRVNWTLPKLKVAINEQYSVAISTVAIWRHLKKIGLSVRRPRPHHYKADKKKQNAFKKN